MQTRQGLRTLHSFSVAFSAGVRPDGWIRAASCGLFQIMIKMLDSTINIYIPTTRVSYPPLPFHPNRQSRDGFPLCRTTCNATNVHRIASGTTLGVLPISTQRGVAVSYYDVKAEARAILADIIIIKCVLLLFSYTCTGTALPQKYVLRAIPPGTVEEG